MNNQFLIFVLLLNTAIVLISCKEKSIEPHSNDISDEMVLSETIEYKMEFPDTVFLNKPYNGVLHYKSILDSITTSFDDKDNDRFPLFIMGISDSINQDEEYLIKHLVKDTFGAMDNRVIPFYDIKFSKVGIQYLDGFINDIVVINLKRKDSEGNDLARLIENNVRVIHKVYVLDSLNINR